MKEKPIWEKLMHFISTLKEIQDVEYYEEMYLPDMGKVKMENEQYVKYLCDLFSDEYLNGNDAIIERSLNLINTELNTINESTIENWSRHKVSQTYLEEFVKDSIFSLQTLQQYLSGLLPVIKTPETNTNNNASESFEPLDLQISSKDAHRLIVLWELDIIDFLQREGYSTNLIGEMIAELFQQKNGKSIGSLIGKMGTDDSDSPIHGDKNLALRMKLSAWKTKYRKTR
mgnify:CR=1 FL=1